MLFLFMDKTTRGMQFIRLSDALESGDVSSSESVRRLESVGQYLNSVCKAGRYFRIGDQEGLISEDYENFFDNHQELFDFFPGVESSVMLSVLGGHVARIEHILATGEVNDASRPLNTFLGRLGCSYIEKSYYDPRPAFDDGLFEVAQP